MSDVERFKREYGLFLGAERAEERRLRSLIDALPSVRIKAAAEALRDVGFVAGACHQQCHDVAARLPAVTHVFGWTVNPLYYSCHSVLRDPGGGYRCITPGHVDAKGLDDNGCFEFRIDPQFTWMNGGMYRGLEPGIPGWAIIRRDARQVDRAYRGLLDRIQRGELTFDEAAQLRA